MYVLLDPKLWHLLHSEVVPYSTASSREGWNVVSNSSPFPLGRGVEHREGDGKKHDCVLAAPAAVTACPAAGLRQSRISSDVV